jgi:multidrug resistance efflux pump
MDIKVETRPKTNIKQWLLGGAIAAIVISSFVLSSDHSAQVPEADIWVGEVKQGDLQQTVGGFGRLKSKDTRLLTAYSAATVEEILLKPGALVTPNSVIARLVDPALAQSVKAAERMLTQTQNQLLQLQINQKRELLAQQSALEVMRSRQESAELEVSAQDQLAQQGVVSQLEFQRSLLEHRQLTRQVEFEEQRIAQLAELHAANIAIAQSNIDAQQEALDLVKQTESRLIIRAGIAGVLQSSSLELGQSVMPGQQLTLVGSMHDLYALLEIPQSNMQYVAVGQRVEVDTRNGIIQGEVSRVEPVVNNGTIQVEVTLTSGLTDNARPELNIAGTILTQKLENALYIQKPMNAAINSHSTLYRVDDDSDIAHATTLQFGAGTNDNIQIVSGAAVNQRFILSDMSQWEDHDTVAIVQ